MFDLIIPGGIQDFMHNMLLFINHDVLNGNVYNAALAEGDRALRSVGGIAAGLLSMVTDGFNHVFDTVDSYDSFAYSVNDLVERIYDGCVDPQ